MPHNSCELTVSCSCSFNQWLNKQVYKVIVINWIIFFLFIKKKGASRLTKNRSIIMKLSTSNKYVFYRSNTTSRGRCNIKRQSIIPFLGWYSVAPHKSNHRKLFFFPSPVFQLEVDVKNWFCKFIQWEFSCLFKFGVTEKIFIL